MGRFARLFAFLSVVIALAGAPGAARAQTNKSSAQPIAAATSNAALAIRLYDNESVIAFNVSGLTAAGATLTLEGSSDARGQADAAKVWVALNAYPINTTCPPVQFSTLTSDQAFRVQVAGLTDVRLRVSSTGTGTILAGYNAIQGADLSGGAFCPFSSAPNGGISGPPLTLVSTSFPSKALFQAASSIPAGVQYVTVGNVNGTYPPASGAVATPLTYRRVNSTTGLWGEITVAGVIFDPIYSTYPINFGEWGIVSDGTFSGAGAVVNGATANGTTTLTMATTPANCNGYAGLNVASINYATRAAASLSIVPVNTTLVSCVTNTSITLSNSVPTGTMNLVIYNLAMTGTDNDPAFQAALNFGLQYGYPDFTCPAGRYLLNDTLTAGWVPFAEVRIKGGQRAPYAGTLPGCSLLFSKIDRGGLNFQAMRYAGLSGVALYGPNYNFVSLSQGGGSNTLSSNPADWLAPELVPAGGSPGGLTQHTPLVGISIDARSGASPSPAYPNQTFPAWTGLSSQYNQGFSSDVDIHDVEVGGFAVGIAGGLNANGNGDFVKLHKIGLYGNIYALGMFQSQGRNTELDDITCNGTYTFLSNRALGEQTGNLGGPISNFNCSDSYQLFDLALSASGPLVINNAYCEVCVRIGNLVGGTTFEAGVIFHGGSLSIGDGITGQIPAAYITNTGNSQFVFDEMNVSGNSRISNLVLGGAPEVHLRGGNFNMATLSATTAALQQAVNYSGGMLAGSSRFNSSSFNNFHVDANANMSYFPTVSGSVASLIHNDTLSFQTSGSTLVRAPMTQAGRFYLDEQKRQWRLTVPPEAVIQLATTTIAGTPPSYSNDVMTFGYCTFYQTTLSEMATIAVGDMLYVQNTGTLFVVTAVSGPSANAACTVGTATTYTITTQQQNNLTLIPLSNTFVSNTNSDTTLSGNTVVIKTGAVIPSVLFYCAFTSSLTAFTGCSEGDGTSVGAGFSSYYSVGDILLCPLITMGNSSSPWYCGKAGNSLATVVNGAPGTGTLGSNALASGTFPVFPYEIR